MFVLNHLTTTRLLLFVVVLIARQAICDNKLNQTNHISITTAPPKSTPAIVEVKQHPTVVNHQLGSSLPAASVTTSPPTVKIDAKAAPVVTKVPPTTPIANAPSSAPTQAIKTSTGTINTPVANVTTTAAATQRTPGHWLVEYFEPICNHLDKLLPEHIFKIQSQLKQFVEKTAGKMSVCFMQHFLIDPNLKAVEKAQLGTICSSEHLPANVNGSFRDFQACAEHNWDKSLDQELERIIKLRLNCFFNHTHSKNDSTISLVHDNDDISLIGEVVNKVLNTNSKSGPIGKANVTMIDVGSSSSTKVPATVVATGGHANKTVGPQTTPAANPKSSANKNILNDPNTLLVFVDDATTKAPVKVLQAPIPTQAAAATHVVSVANDKVSVAPAVNTSATPALAVLVTTLKPASKSVVTTNAPHLVLKNETHAPVPVVKVAAVAATTAKPLATVLGEKILDAASTNAPVLPVKVVTAQPTTSPKPLVVVVASTVKPTVIPVVASTSSPSAAAAAASVAAAAAKSQPITVVVSTVAPTNAAKVVANSTTVAKIVTNATTTSRPATVVITSVKPLSTTKQPLAASTRAPSAKPLATTKQPQVASTKAASTKPSAATQQPQPASTQAPSAIKPSTTGKPAVVGETGSKKSDSDKHQSDSKVKDDEKKTAQSKKEQDENDAKNAIKALQKQRAGHVADARMHQIEHERQMTIDPVGHTLKHQKYEQLKQQKTSTTPAPSANKKS